ncbi:hypothetical protein U9M48_029760, partial [Paspalum notatum var. saurae]
MAVAANRRPGMHPLMAEATCKGNWNELDYLLNREEYIQAQSSKNPSQEFLDNLAAYHSSTGDNRGNNGARSMPQQATTADVEEGIATAAVALLKGVTVEGDTALHLVAAGGEKGDFLRCADLIHGKDKAFLCKQNDKGDTPLHCAARAGRPKMVSHLVRLAREDNMVEDLLRRRNSRDETVLHQAVRNGDDQLVKDLLAADGKLACFPQEGTSPLFLAIFLEAKSIARTLYEGSENNVLSYAGPNGQNALHAAVLRDPVLTEELLKWNKGKDLTIGQDENGSTPLHFAAGLTSGPHAQQCYLVFKANTTALYQPDKDGRSPIHVAASVGAVETIAMFMAKECGRSAAGLRDSGGRTFLHVAAEKNRAGVIRDACSRSNRSLAWILNMQDGNGNTALHLAVEAGNLEVFLALFGNRQVNLNLTNGDGQTPMDIARYKIRPSFHDHSNAEIWIKKALTFGKARRGVSREDHFDEKYKRIYGVDDYKTKELEMLKDSTQSYSIASVLIATVTFGAMFAMPGGYRQDDHDYGGTPTLAEMYAFHAFLVADTIAFICSSMATIGFMHAGSAVLDLVRRTDYFYKAINLMHNSIIALATAFAVGVYTVLAPVAQKTAIAICVMSPLVVAYNFKDFWVRWFNFTPSLYGRKGLIYTVRLCTCVVLVNMLTLSVFFVFTFVWAAYGSNSNHISTS